MDLLFSTSDFPGITDPVIYRAYESTNPSVVVADSGNINPPHSAPANIIIPGVNPIPHIIRCFQLPTGATIGILRKEFWIDPTFQNYNGEEVKFYVVDGGLTNDPINGTRTINDPYLDNKRYTVERRNKGTLVYEEIGHTRDEYDQVIGGGFIINDPADVFQPDEVFCVRIQARVSSAIPIATSVSIFQDILDITADVDLSTITYKKKLLNLMSATTRLTVTLDFVANVADNSIIPITSQFGLHINAVIKCQAGEKIYWNRNVYSQLIIGINEELWLTKKGTFYYIVKGCESISKRGTRITSTVLDIPNTVFPVGQLVERLDYPGIFELLNNHPTLLVNEANWDDASTDANGIAVKINRGYFTLGTTGTNMRLPDWSNRFFRTIKDGGVDAARITQGSGGLQGMSNTPHTHLTVNNHSDTTGEGLDANKSVDFQGEQAGTADFKYTLRGNAAAADRGKTSSNGLEGRPENLAEYSLLYI